MSNVGVRMIAKKYKIIFIAVFISTTIVVSTESFSQMPNKYINGLKKIALQDCVFLNYNKIGAINRIKANDASLWLYPYFYEQTFSLEEIKSFNDFVEKNTDKYCEEILPLKQDGDKAFSNAIFGRCIEFYESEKLHNFIKKMR